MFSNCERNEQNEKEVTVNQLSSDMMDTDEMLVVVYWYSKSFGLLCYLNTMKDYPVHYIFILLHIHTVWNICPLHHPSYLKLLFVSAKPFAC